MAFEKLVLVRHGHYDETGVLTDYGRGQVVRLADALRPLLSGKSITVASSTVIRAFQTAEILVNQLGVSGFSRNTFLISTEGKLRESQIASALGLIAERGKEYEVVVLVSHIEFVDRLPTIWGNKSGFKIPENGEPRLGSARVIDAQTGKVETINT